MAWPCQCSSRAFLRLDPKRSLTFGGQKVSFGSSRLNDGQCATKRHGAHSTGLLVIPNRSFPVDYGSPSSLPIIDPAARRGNIVTLSRQNQFQPFLRRHPIDRRTLGWPPPPKRPIDRRQCAWSSRRKFFSRRGRAWSTRRHRSHFWIPVGERPAIWLSGWRVRRER
jgi:hypothetical protein